MAVSREELFRQALQLDESECAALVGLLIDSIDSDGEEGVEATWMAEIEQRIVELDRGTGEEGRSPFRLRLARGHATAPDELAIQGGACQGDGASSQQEHEWMLAGEQASGGAGVETCCGA